MRLLSTSFTSDLLPSFAQPPSRLNGARAPIIHERVGEAGPAEVLDDPFSTPFPLPWPNVRALAR